MLVKINAKNATVYGREQAAMEKKIEQRFSRYFESDDVVFSVKIREEKIGFKVELTLPYYGYQLRAEASDKLGAMAAFDSAIDIMERRMAKHKDKLLSRNKRGGEVVVVAEAPVDEPYDVVRTKTYEMKPMSVQDAILNMEVLGHEFYMFFNADENKICTVYRRKDGGYGMIMPQ
jgi:putative sigma-54 modulation protein